MLNFDLVDPAELTGYVRDIPFGDLRLNGLLPDEPVEDLAYRLTRGSTVDVDAAMYRAFDSEAPIGARQGITRIEGEILPISKKLLLGEEAGLRLRALQSGSNRALVDQIYADARNLARAVAVRLELARGEALVTGKVVLDENGVQATIDFGRDAAHDVAPATVVWSNAAAVPITDLLAWKGVYNNTNGVDPGAILVSDTIITALLSLQSVRDHVANVVNVTPNLVTRAQLAAVLEAHGLPPFVEINTKFRVAGSAVRVIDPDVAVFLPPAGEPLGSTLYGVTAEAMRLAELGRIELTEAPGIVAVVEDTSDPVATWTKASGLALPVLANPDLTLAATVL